MRLATGTEIQAQALIFNLDGTLVDSTAVIAGLWRKWSHDRQNGERLIRVDIVPPVNGMARRAVVVGAETGNAVSLRRIP